MYETEHIGLTFGPSNLKVILSLNSTRLKKDGYSAFGLLRSMHITEGSQQSN